MIIVGRCCIWPVIPELPTIEMKIIFVLNELLGTVISDYRNDTKFSETDRSGQTVQTQIRLLL